MQRYIALFLSLVCIVSTLDSSIEALRGTTSWFYDNGDGTQTGIESDSMHPLDINSKEHMPTLLITPTLNSSKNPLEAVLQFDVNPDEVSVHCWSDEHWGNTYAESEDILLNDFSIELKDSGYIYEVIAHWSSSEKYGGKAYYSFYATDIIQLNFSTQDFSNIPLSILNDNQIGNIVNLTKIDDMVTYVEYVPKELNEENPEDYTYSYIEVSGVKYILSSSIGDTWYDLRKTMLNKTDSVYMTNELRGASYGVTVFFVIKEKTPYIISEIDGFAQISDIDENGTKEIVSTVGTVPDTSIYFFDFDKQTVSIANINEKSDAKYSMYDVTTNTFSLAFEPNQNPVNYVYETNDQLRVEKNIK